MCNLLATFKIFKSGSETGLNCLCFTCWFTNNEMCTLVHFELPCVAGTMLLTEPLHLFPLCAGEAGHTNSTATQHRAQIVLDR